VNAAVASASRRLRRGATCHHWNAKSLRRFAGIVRESAGTGNADAIDCGNPVRAMVGDAEIAAAQIDFRRPGY
jgi:betaine-aldehyde dehydrogenase